MTPRQEKVVLNPSAVAPEGRIEIDLHSGNIQIGEEGPDWGEKTIEAFMAEMAVGSKPIDTRLPNRVITIPLILGATGDFDAARIALEAECQRINEEGAIIMRELIGGTYGEAGSRVYADIVAKASLKLGRGNMPASKGFDPNAELTFEALPDWYGDEIEGEVHEFTGDGSFTLISKGTLPGRVTDLKVTDLSGVDQLALPWHLRCKNYSAAETAEWAYEAEALTPLDTAAVAELAGASGGSVIEHANLSTSWTPVLSTNLLSGDYLTHVGLYDLWARVYSTSKDLPWLRFLYGVGDLVSPQENQQVRIPGVSNFFAVNLGQVNLRQLAEGDHRWQGIIQARGESGGENISIDRLFLFCADEASGIPKAPLTFPTTLTGYQLRDEFNQSEHTLNEQQLAASGAVSGPKAPGTVEDKAGIGTAAWSNPENAKSSNNAYAEVNVELLTTGPESHYLKATGFGFAIPEGATVTGIVAAVERSSPTTTKFEIEDLAVRIVKGGTIEPTNKAMAGEWPAADTNAIYGGAGDTWGTTWTPAQINAENFGLAIAVKEAHLVERGGGAIKGAIAKVDSITITVYYNEGSATTWVTSGDAVDLKIIAATHTVKRAEVSDASINQGRYAIAGASTFTNIIAQIRTKREASEAAASEEVRQGALIRYTNEENWLMGCYDFVNTSGSGEESLRILKRKAGTVTELVPKISVPISNASTLWRYAWIEANTQGRVLLWASLSESSAPELIAVVFDTDFATGGTLATGKIGFYDAKTGSKANTREYDGFAAWVPNQDAAIFGGLSCSLSSKRITRLTSDGNGMSSIAYPGSDLPRLPVSGPEEFPVEIAFKTSRGEFDVAPDAGLDPFLVQLSYQPCWSEIPSS